MLLVIDNYDSFTYNLVQYLGELGADVDVRRNDAITVDEIGALAPSAIVLSPGPCAGVAPNASTIRGRCAAMADVTVQAAAKAVIVATISGASNRPC